MVSRNNSIWNKVIRQLETLSRTDHTTFVYNTLVQHLFEINYSRAVFSGSLGTTWLITYNIREHSLREKVFEYQRDREKLQGLVQKWYWYTVSIIHSSSKLHLVPCRKMIICEADRQIASYFFVISLLLIKMYEKEITCKIQ